MGKYLLKRLLHGLVSVIIVVFIVMVLVYLCMDRSLIFAKDPNYIKLNGNQKTFYTYQRYAAYGYLSYTTYSEYLLSIGLSPEEMEAADFANTPSEDSALAKKYVAEFTEHFESEGYTVMRLKYKPGAGNSKYLFAYKDINVFKRLWSYFTGIFNVDTVRYASGIAKEDRKITFTWHDPAYGGKKFSPAIMGNGTKHKYLLYFDNKFPFIHQNLLTISLGTSYSVNRGIDVWDTMTNTQGEYVQKDVIYPTGFEEFSATDLHSAVYVPGSRELGGEYMKTRFTDDYTGVSTYKNGMSRMGYSFSIGIFSVIIAYLLGIPLGILMARKKNKLADKLGTIYVVFIIAVPSLAYIFMFKQIGSLMKLPTTFVTGGNALYYILPIVSLALPSIGNLMKWMRRYMIDQSNADYVKFARSGGLTEGQIFTKHIMKNAAVPILHGIPGSVLGAITGAIITERVYVVPGVGNVLTQAINAYDNGVIVGVTLFYAVLSIVSLILGDILMAMIDPRISFSTKAR